MLKYGSKLILAIMVLIGLSNYAFAEDAPAPAPAAGSGAPSAPAPKWYDVVTVSGMADVYIANNGNGSTNGTGVGTNTTTGFTPDSSEFALSLFELNLEKKPSKDSPTGFYIGLWGGQTAQATLPTAPLGNASGAAINSNSKESAFQGIFRQIYGSILLTPEFQIDLGKFATPIGIEVAESNANWNYSRGLLYNFGEPVVHTGLRATYTFNDSLSAMFCAVNGWNNDYNTTTGKGLHGQIAYAPIKALPLVANYYVGTESNGTTVTGAGGVVTPVMGSRTLLDLNATFNVTDTFAIAASYDNGNQSNGALANATTGIVAGTTANWNGFAVYAKYSGSLPFLTAIALRYESYSDPQGFTTQLAGGQTLTEGTITLEKKVDAALLRLEGRQDSSNQKFFNVAGNPNTTSQTQTLVLFSGVFAF
ncbi:MAG: outer membrane beta-barrel protein [Nitrospinae bacterium]|nr:outer membrane beta-barrel protein [Nitrospinota bacterium]